MKKILFPTDFSDNAQNAFKYTLHLSKLLSSSITSMHVQDGASRYHAYLPENVMAEFRKTMSQDYELFLIEAQKNRSEAASVGISNLEIDYELKEGKVVEAILTTAEENKTDLIVMGTKDEASLRKYLWGSNTIKVIKHGNLPVLVVPENASFRPIKKIGLALPPNQWEERVILQAEEYARILGAQLCCFSVINPNEPSKLNKLKQKMKIYEFEFRNYENIDFQIVENYSLFGGINEHLNANEIDLLSIHYVEKGRFEHMFGGNHVEGITLGTEMPLLVLK